MAILRQILFCAGMFGALKHGFRSLATLKLAVNVVGELKPKRTAAASRGSLATARLSCFSLSHEYSLRTVNAFPARRKLSTQSQTSSVKRGGVMDISKIRSGPDAHARSELRAVGTESGRADKWTARLTVR